MAAIATASATSSAPASAFFDRWADMDTWSEWNTDTEWVRLDGAFVQGATGTLKPKGGPKVHFTVERLDEHTFIDVSRMPGGRVIFDHRISSDEDSTRVDVDVSIEGPLGFLWRRILGSGFRGSLQADLDRLVGVVEHDAQSPA